MRDGPARRIVERLAQPVDIASLIAFRVMFGLAMFVSVVRFWSNGWIASLYIEPQTHLTYWGFGWVSPWPGVGMYVHFAALAVCAFCICIGFCYRLATALFFVGFTYVELLDQAAYLNHYYLVSLVSFLMIWLPLHRSGSVEAWRAPEARRSQLPLIDLLAVRVQIGLVYTFAGIAKLQSDWLVDAKPLSIWLKAHTDTPWIGPWLGRFSVAWAMSLGGAVFDLSIVWLLLWAKTRRLAICAVIVFHAVTGYLFPIGMFPWLMAGFALVLLPPDWPRAWMRKLGWVQTARMAGPMMASRNQIYVFAIFLTIGFSMQLLLPLRHHLYPGDVAWTEEGGRFAWRVMVTEKVGDVVYRVRNPVSGRAWTVRPERYLTVLQEKELSVQPDMILSFAHQLAARYPMPVEVYADVFVSLNGRPAARLIDPTVNLVNEQESLAAKDWILPGPQ